MLGKLLKYDFKSLFKFLIIFYSLALFFAILTRIFFNIEDSFIMGIIAQVCSGATIAMIFNIIINNLMRLWVRFKSDFYSDESYLTHTLPIRKSTLYLSKFLSGITTMFVSVFVIALVLFIAYYSKENMTVLKNLLLPVAQIYESSVPMVIIAFLFICFLELFNGLQSGFTGIIIGHSKNNAKVGKSVLYGFITYLLTQVVVLIVLGIGAFVNSDLMNLFVTQEMINFNTVKFVILIACISYILTIILLFIVNTKIFNKGVNVE